MQPLDCLLVFLITAAIVRLVIGHHPRNILDGTLKPGQTVVEATNRVLRDADLRDSGRSVHRSAGPNDLDAKVRFTRS